MVYLVGGDWLGWGEGLGRAVRLRICSPDLVAHSSCEDGAPAVEHGECDCWSGDSWGPDLLRRQLGSWRPLILYGGEGVVT